MHVCICTYISIYLCVYMYVYTHTPQIITRMHILNFTIIHGRKYSLNQGGENIIYTPGSQSQRSLAGVKKKNMKITNFTFVNAYSSISWWRSREVCILLFSLLQRIERACYQGRNLPLNFNLSACPRNASNFKTDII